MQDMNDQVMARLAKLDKFKEMGVDAYPHKFNRTHDSKVLKENKDALMVTKEPVAFAGRVVRFNRKGKMCFMHLKDRYGRLQVVVARDEVGEENYEIVKMTDLGDFIGVNGTMFETQSGEYSVRAEKVTMLSKAVRPLPVAKEKVDENGNKVVFNEFADVDTRYRQRYIDMALNDDVKEVFIKRSKIMQAIREYLIEKGFIEVETPTLQPIYGGANARPFTTHHNACDMTLYLRVAPELYLKRCIIGGMEKVFEFCKNFRNEGMDRTHSPEFTGLEFYEAYADYNDMMVHFENIYERACIAANGTTKINYQGKEIDFKAPWPRYSMIEAIEKFGGVTSMVNLLVAVASWNSSTSRWKASSSSRQSSRTCRRKARRSAKSTALSKALSNSSNRMPTAGNSVTLIPNLTTRSASANSSKTRCAADAVVKVKPTRWTKTSCMLWKAVFRRRAAWALASTAWSCSSRTSRPSATCSSSRS